MSHNDKKKTIIEVLELLQSIKLEVKEMKTEIHDIKKYVTKEIIDEDIEKEYLIKHNSWWFG
tara:strand:- start:553 stop:738 length:186 start_codon:yes stop_codon:yes gene_type:complete